MSTGDEFSGPEGAGVGYVVVCENDVQHGDDGVGGAVRNASGLSGHIEEVVAGSVAEAVCCSNAVGVDHDVAAHRVCATMLAMVLRSFL